MSSVGRGAVRELLWLLGNLLALEEHLAELGRPSEELAEARAKRYEALSLLVRAVSGKDPKETGLREDWCVAKHLLLASMHAYEAAGMLAPSQDSEELLRMSRELMEKAEKALLSSAQR